MAVHYTEISKQVPQIEVYTFPTVILYKNGSNEKPKSPLEYDGDISLEQLVTFLKTHVQCVQKMEAPKIQSATRTEFWHS